MRTSKPRSASSRQRLSAAGSAARSTTAVWSPCWACVSITDEPRRARSRSRIAAPSTVSVPLGPDRDLFLELHEPVDHRLRTGRAAWNVDVDGNDRVDPLHGGVVVVEPARARADAKGDDPLRLGHLLVDAFEHGRHLVRDRADDEQHVGLTWRETREPCAEAIDVVMRARCRHVLHATARRHERVLEDGVLPSPADGFVQPRREEAAYSHSSPPLRQMYRYPSMRIPRNTIISTKPNQPRRRKSIAHSQRKNSSMSNRMKRIATVENLIGKRPSLTAIGSFPHSNGASFTGVRRRGASSAGIPSSAPATPAAKAKVRTIGQYSIYRRSAVGSDRGWPVLDARGSAPRTSVAARGSAPRTSVAALSACFLA